MKANIIAFLNSDRKTSESIEEGIEVTVENLRVEDRKEISKPNGTGFLEDMICCCLVLLKFFMAICNGG